MTEEGMPTEEQLREQIRQLTIDDILLQTIVTLINLSGHKLTAQDEEEKDVEQAQARHRRRPGAAAAPAAGAGRRPGPDQGRAVPAPDDLRQGNRRDAAGA